MKTRVHEGGGGITVEIGSDELREIIAEYVARYAGFPMPTMSEGRWRWGSGEPGPTLYLTVERVSNVTRLDDARNRPTVRGGRRLT